MFSLRWYQLESVSAAWSFLCSLQGNPVIVLPTGSGKSLVIAQLCKDAVEKYHGKVIVLAHRKELLEQNADKIKALLPDMDVGLYSAGLRARDTEHDIVVAGIQSAFRHAHDFGQRNLVLIDEVHLCPHDGEGMYRTFLSDLRSANERLRMIGLTATPYRLDAGPICRPDGLFQKVCYSAPVQRLIADGYLCNLTTKPAASAADTSGLRLRSGEFIPAEAEALFSADRLVSAACTEIVEKTRDRKSVLIFCSGVNHAGLVARTIERLAGEPCGIVTGETMPILRDGTLTAFRNRQLRFLCNVDVLTTGFDSPCIDCIAILRATMSAGLFCQICGRAFRVYPAKQDALVLDFGGNIARHGPIDAIDYGRCKRTGAQPGEAPTKTCPNCGIECYAGASECECGFLFPVREPNHEDKADQGEILSKPEKWLVEEINYARHIKRKAGPEDPPTLRVDYLVRPLDSDEGGNLMAKTISEYVCLEHQGYAQAKARRWWARRSIAPFPASVDDASELANRGALAWSRTITTRRDGKWMRILSAELEEKPTEWMEAMKAGVDAFEELPF
ncbi:MAG: DEAD/DEAH box helicase [Phycisphaerae bacterium]|nr:DEAD/DEAH box helicase [Phycisphaerae bacterium]